MDLSSVITSIFDAVVHFSTAIQWALTFITSLFNGILDIYSFAFDSYSHLHFLFDVIPGWLLSFALIFIAYCVIIFFIHLGGD